MSYVTAPPTVLARPAVRVAPLQHQPQPVTARRLHAPHVAACGAGARWHLESARVTMWGRRGPAEAAQWRIPNASVCCGRRAAAGPPAAPRRRRGARCAHRPGSRAACTWPAPLTGGTSPSPARAVGQARGRGARGGRVIGGCFSGGRRCRRPSTGDAARRTRARVRAKADRAAPVLVCFRTHLEPREYAQHGEYELVACLLDLDACRGRAGRRRDGRAPALSGGCGASGRAPRKLTAREPARAAPQPLCPGPFPRGRTPYELDGPPLEAPLRTCPQPPRALGAPLATPHSAPSARPRTPYELDGLPHEPPQRHQLYSLVHAVAAPLVLRRKAGQVFQSAEAQRRRQRGRRRRGLGGEPSSAPGGASGPRRAARRARCVACVRARTLTQVPLKSTSSLAWVPSPAAAACAQGRRNGRWGWGCCCCCGCWPLGCAPTRANGGGRRAAATGRAALAACGSAMRAAKAPQGLRCRALDARAPARSRRCCSAESVAVVERTAHATWIHS